MQVDTSLLNVIQLGVGMMLILTAFQSCALIQQTVIKSAIHNDNLTDLGGLDEHSGFYSLSIIYALFAIGNFIAAPITQFLGPRIGMVVGAMTYVLYLGSFLYLRGYLLYIASALIGLGAAILWTGEGCYMTENSTPRTTSRNSGVVWALLQSSFLFGSIFLFVVFRNKESISEYTKMIVYAPFTVLSFLGLICMLLLKTVPARVNSNTHNAIIEDADEVKQLAKGRWASFASNFKQTFKMLRCAYMLLLLITFFYAGLVLCFYSGVYTTAVANTKYFKTDANSLIGLTGMFIGVGEIIGGVVFGALGERTIKFSRNPVIMLGFVSHNIAFLIIFLNIPDEAVHGDSYNLGYIRPNMYLAVFCGFCLGFGDACWLTQIFSILMCLHPSEPKTSSGFALLKLGQAGAAAVGFYYSSYAGLHSQLMVLVVTCFAAALCFFYVELKICTENSTVSSRAQSKFWKLF